MDFLFFSFPKMEFELVRIFIAFFGLLIGTYFDIFNKKSVPDKFLYLFLGICILANLFDFQTLPFALGIGIFTFFVFYILYKTGQIGGADAYIISALAFILPFQPNSFLILEQPFGGIFIFNLFVYSGILFMVYMFIYSLKFIREISINKEKLFKVGLILISYLVFVFIAYNSAAFIIGLESYLLFISLLIIFLIYFLLIEDKLKASFTKFVSANEIEIEDIIDIDSMDKDLVKKYSLSRLVTKEQYEKLKKIKGKKIALFKDLPPFLPFLLVGFILAVLLGNPLFLIL
jgi:Flp pilus assembly protein protease CpaA